MPRRFPILAAFLVTTGCQVGGEANDNAAAPTNTALPANDTVPPAAPKTATATDPNVPPPPHLDPDAPPLAGEETPAGAARRALEYCDALATRRFRDAYALWADDGRASGLTLAEFTAQFANARISDCQLSEPTEIQGGAGSLYIEIPAVIRGTTTAGRPLRLEGPILLRRVNDIPGSTAKQRRWHIARAEFPNL